MKIKTNKYLGFNDIPLMFVGIPILGLLIPIIFFRVNPSDPGVQWGYFLGSTVYTACYWIGDRYIFIWLRKIYPDFVD